MRQKKWRGTMLFVTILAVMGATVGLRLYGSGLRTTAVALATSVPQTANDPAPSQAETTAAPSPAAVASPAAASRSINGAVVQTPYGPIQVSVTFVNNRITSVKELQAPRDQDRSIEINASAEPILAREVLKSQSARIDTVSGATYTSEGYARSVQSAIDRL